MDHVAEENAEAVVDAASALAAESAILEAGRGNSLCVLLSAAALSSSCGGLVGGVLLPRLLDALLPSLVRLPSSVSPWPAPPISWLEASAAREGSLASELGEPRPLFPELLLLGFLGSLAGKEEVLI
jgi:hypothetical protein